MNQYAVLNATARIEPSEQAWDLLDRMTKVYLGPAEEFPAPKKPGFVIHYDLDRIAGVGPWAG